MDRATLKLMLSSGKFLCYNPNALDGRWPSGIDPDELTFLTIRKYLPPGRLFDSSLLTHAVFFKEATTDQYEEYSISTRVMLVFNEANAREGGVSSVVEPDHFIDALEKYFGGELSVVFSNHDRHVLQVFTETPTFDPFLLRAQRRRLEEERVIDDSYFNVSTMIADSVRRIIDKRAKLLAALALGPGIPDERYHKTVGGLCKAIWDCETNDRTRRLLKSLKTPDAKMERTLFALKGISYYEYQFRQFSDDYGEFLKWLGGPDSLPADANMAAQGTLDKVTEFRKRSQLAMRGYYSHAKRILDRHDAAYEALIDRGDPQTFQQFLLEAPDLFETLGLSMGAFGHATNAWKKMTNDGRRRMRDAERLEPFYRFISTLSVPPPSDC